MSDHIPFHIQEEIMKRLPVKSLIQLRSVSKTWKSLIDSSNFIVAHTLHNHNQPHHLLVSYEYPPIEEDYVLFSKCYIDDDNFPQPMSVPTLPQFIQQLILPRVIGTSRGLLCLCGSDPDSKAGMAVILNPSIRKSIVVADVPREPFSFDVLGEPSVGFGVCPVTSDPKIVVVTQFCEYMVYTLSSRKWRSLSTNLPSIQIGLSFCSVTTDRFLYWSARSKAHKMITSFDLTTESFEVISHPNSIAHYRLSKLGESLALLQYGEAYNFSTVWIMEHHGSQRSFTKLFTIKTPHESIVGFSKNGIPIMQVMDDQHLRKLVVYEPNSEHNNVLEICPPVNFYCVDSYMETLFLLGRSDCSSY